MQAYDIIIIGAGAAGLMCAVEAGKRGRSVLLIDHAKKPAEKIRISGGGRCNFTNLHASPANFLSENPRFCVSALSRYTQHDFIQLVQKHQIAYHEKTLGQLFCDGSSQQIIDMLLEECRAANVRVALQTKAEQIQKTEAGFSLSINNIPHLCESLVIATGGKSIPKMGATGFGYEVAKQFGLNIIEPRAALVPFTFEGGMLEVAKGLAGVAVQDVEASCNGQHFREAMLFTHRGLSGPAILQISSYWKPGEAVQVNLATDRDVFAWLKSEKEKQPKQDVQNLLATVLPKRLAACLCEDAGCVGKLADLSHKKLQLLSESINRWCVVPDGTEGYRTAEVTIGGVDTKALSSKTMECNAVKGLYFIGEVVDVTGHLGGFNFQWAWSSGHAAGQVV